MAFNYQKKTGGSWMVYGVVGVAVLAFLFFTEKGKSVVAMVKGLFTKKTTT